MIVSHSSDLWNVMPCVRWKFNDISNEDIAYIFRESRSDCYLLLAGCLLVLFFYPEDGGSIFLQKVREIVLDYRASNKNEIV
jgi:hypothetical protein